MIRLSSLWTVLLAVAAVAAGAAPAVEDVQGLYEGTLWQYRWAVPHDVPGLVTLAGGEDAFRAQLDQYFDEELHNHGNEPALHAPFLFHYVGAPDRTQEVVRALLVEPVDQWYGTHEKWSAPHQGRIFRLEPDGLLPEMDDDAGTMAAWFVLAAIGLYPVTVGQPVYLVLAALRGGHPAP